MWLSQLYHDAVQRLRLAGIREAETETTLLLCSCFNVTRSDLILDHEREIDDFALNQFQAMVDRRTTGEPGNYILGSREFWSMEFKVTPDVLIPRPETEFLLEETFQTLAASAACVDGMVLDLCTGSGVIAVVLAKELTGCRIVALDNSIAALNVASENICRHGVGKRVDIVCGDLFSALAQRETFQLIVTNPPYIESYIIDSLQAEVCDYEPRQALDGGVNGLHIIQQIIYGSMRYLHPGGWLFMEIGADQETLVLNIFSGERARGIFDKAAVVKDWAGRPRVLKVRKATSSEI